MKLTKIIISAVTLVAFTSCVSHSDQKSYRSVHVFVALCDNKTQGIVPVPPKLGNGEDPKNNLYWGALYGVKSFFKRSKNWKLLETIQNPANPISERCIFRHKRNSVYLVADAYRGAEIRRAVTDFLQSASGNSRKVISVKDPTKSNLKIKGSSELIVYVGHNGLMDFQLEKYPGRKDKAQRDAIILACESKQYFKEPLLKSGARPLLWTTGLMAPEAYTLESAIEGWILRETNEAIRLRAAKAYHKYQKCGLNSAKRLFATGMK